MDTNSMELSSELASASRKFYKSCEQIKIIKQRIGELVDVFAYCEQEINRIRTTATTSGIAYSHNHESSSALSSCSQTPSSSSVLVESGSSISNRDSQIANLNLSNNTSSSSFNYSDDLDYSDRADLLQDCDEMNVVVLSSSEDDSYFPSSSHMNAFRESIRQQIENLHCVKTAYFMYAHRKADEITRIQCELFGEDAVREAYELADPEALLPEIGSDGGSGRRNGINSSHDDDDEREVDDEDEEEEEELSREAFGRELAAVENDNGAVSRSHGHHHHHYLNRSQTSRSQLAISLIDNDEAIAQSSTSPTLTSSSTSSSWSPWDFNHYNPLLDLLRDSNLVVCENNQNDQINNSNVQQEESKSSVIITTDNNPNSREHTNVISTCISSSH